MSDTQTDPLQTAYDAILAAAAELGNVGAAANDERLITLAQAGAILNACRGCDGCDRVMDEEVFAEAGYQWAQAYDGNGEPDVAICPVCLVEP